jgi:hypothetical protein
MQGGGAEWQLASRRAKVASIARGAASCSLPGAARVVPRDVSLHHRTDRTEVGVDQFHQRLAVADGGVFLGKCHGGQQRGNGNDDGTANHAEHSCG